MPVVVPDVIDGGGQLLEVLVHRQAKYWVWWWPKRSAVRAEIDGLEVEALRVVAFRQFGVEEVVAVPVHKSAPTAGRCSGASQPNLTRSGCRAAV